MRAVVLACLVPALLATSSAGSLLHTHAYPDHDRREHHHGWAAHAHRVVLEHDDSAAHLEAVDPGQYAVPFAIVSPAVPQGHAHVADLSLPVAVPEVEPFWQAVECADLRVHAPPIDPSASPRAPPLFARL